MDNKQEQWTVRLLLHWASRSSLLSSCCRHGHLARHHWRGGPRHLLPQTGHHQQYQQKEKKEKPGWWVDLSFQVLWKLGWEVYGQQLISVNATASGPVFSPPTTGSAFSRSSGVRWGLVEVWMGARRAESSILTSPPRQPASAALQWWRPMPSWPLLHSPLQPPGSSGLKQLVPFSFGWTGG